MSATTKRKNPPRSKEEGRKLSEAMKKKGTPSEPEVNQETK